MKKKHRTTLELIFARPVSANIKWRDIEALFIALGEEVSEREVSDHGAPNLQCYRPIYVQAYAAQADALHLRHPAIAYRFNDNR